MRCVSGDAVLTLFDVHQPCLHFKLQLALGLSAAHQGCTSGTATIWLSRRALSESSFVGSNALMILDT